MDATNQEWQNLKKEWREKIKDFGESREGVLSSGGMLSQIKNGTSLLDPVLAEVIVRWFGVKGGVAFDPFAGDSVFGYVSATLGMDFRGIELRKEQAELNTERTKHLNAVYFCDTSENMDLYIKDNSIDLFFSCPPYLWLETYSDNPKDLSNLDEREFFRVYSDILKKGFKKSKDHSFGVLCVGEVRRKSGDYANFVGESIKIMCDAGWKFYNEIILADPIGSLPLRAGKVFLSSRKIGKRHQNVLVFVKGDAKVATKKCNFISEEDFNNDGENMEF